MPFKLKVHKTMGLVEDTILIQDPWTGELTLRVHRKSSRVYLRHMRDRARKNPVVVRINAALTRVASELALEGRDSDSIDATEAKVLIENALETELTKGALNAGELAEMSDAAALECCALLVEWSGPGAPMDEKGVVAPMTTENKLEFFTDPTPVREGQPFAGQSLGAAFRELVRAASEGADILRNAYLQEAGKESGPGLEPSSAPGPTPPETAEISESASTV